jgi:Pyridine nucleotide-disulphide oxidoreductase, dimerisation domain
LFAVETLEPSLLDKLPGFKRRLEWFLDNRPDLTSNVASMQARGTGNRRLLALVGSDQLKRILRIMLDEQEFLSHYGIRSLSQFHRTHPYTLSLDGAEYRVDYDPAESGLSQTVGLHVIGDRAAEIVHIGQVVVIMGGTIEYFRDTVCNYPTLAEAYKVAALDGLNKL